MAFDMSEALVTALPRQNLSKTFSQSRPLKTEVASRIFDAPSHYNSCEPEQRALLDQALSTFEYTEDSIYVGSARTSSKEEYMPCNCKLKRDNEGNKTCCGEYSECINRLLQVECIRGVCPGGKHCKNQRFQRKQNSPVMLIHSENKGYGLQAAEDYSRGQFVMEYVGEVISHNSFIRRTEKYNKRGSKHFYFMSLKSDKYIDATTVGSLARFINHSCNPNCILQKWIVGSHVSIGIFTQRPIKKGEELTFDYKFQRYGAVAQKCYCGEPNCKGVLGSEKQTGSRNSDDPNDIFSWANFNHGLSDDEECSSLVQTMLQLPQDSHKALKILRKLSLTEDSRLLKQFINLHGVVTLKTWLLDYKSEPEVCCEVVAVLEQLPFVYKNKLLDAGVYDTLREYAANSPAMTDQVEELITRWELLPKKYIIPRLPPTTSRTDSNSPDNTSKPDGAVKEGDRASSGSPTRVTQQQPDNSRPEKSQVRNGRWSPYRHPRRDNLEPPRKEANGSNSRPNIRRPNGTFQCRGPRFDKPNRHANGSRNHNGYPNSFDQRSGGMRPSNETNGYGNGHSDGFNGMIDPGNQPALFDNRHSSGLAKVASDSFNIRHNGFANGQLPEFTNHTSDYVGGPPRDSYQVNSGWTGPSFYPQSDDQPYALPYQEHNGDFVPPSLTRSQAALNPVPPEAPLPPNWDSAIAPTGRIYYFHTITKEVTWERPVLTPVSYQQSYPAEVNPPTEFLQPAPVSKKRKESPPTTSTWDSQPKRPRSKSKKIVSDTIYPYSELVARCRKMLSVEVVKSFSAFSGSLSKDIFKKHAERMTTSLLEKEMRDSCYKEGRMRKMTSELREKIGEFVAQYAKRLLEKKLEYEKSLRA